MDSSHRRVIALAICTISLASGLANADGPQYRRLKDHAAPPDAGYGVFVFSKLKQADVTLSGRSILVCSAPPQNHRSAAKFVLAKRLLRYRL